MECISQGKRWKEAVVFWGLWEIRKMSGMTKLENNVFSGVPENHSKICMGEKINPISTGGSFPPPQLVFCLFLFFLFLSQFPPNLATFLKFNIELGKK